MAINEYKIMVENNRPIWVWLVFIWFAVSGLFSLWEFFNSTALVKPTFIENVMRVCFPILSITASSMLLLRFDFNKWIFLFIFLISFMHALGGDAIPEHLMSSWLAMLAVQVVMYALITGYAFKLSQVGYCVRKLEIIFHLNLGRQNNCSRSIRKNKPLRPIRKSNFTNQQL